MTDETRKDGPRHPLYAIELRLHGNEADVAIVSSPRDVADDRLPIDVWRHRFATVDMARAVLQIMMSRPEQWVAWARMAQILGPDFLAGLIEAEVVQAARIAAGHDRHPLRHVRLQSGRTAEAETIRFMLIEKGVPRIVASKGGQPFMMMTFEAAIEARRVWDWTRWQTRSFQHWYDVVRSEGAIALTGLILGSMFAEEERTKAACMPSDETRPLRYWRPLRSGKPDRDSGVDPGANDGSGPDESG